MNAKEFDMLFNRQAGTTLSHSPHGLIPVTKLSISYTRQD